MLTLFLANIFLSLAITTSKVALQNMPSVPFTAIRMGAPGLIMFVRYLYVSKESLIKKIYQNLSQLLFMVIFTAFLPILLKNYSLSHMSSTKFVSICSIDPFVASFWGYMLCAEEISFKKLIAIAIGSAGVMLAISDHPINNHYSSSFFIDACAIVSVFFSKLGWILSKKLVKNNDFKSNEVNAIIMLGCGICSTLISINSNNNLATFLDSRNFILVGTVSILYSLGYYFFGKSIVAYPVAIVSLTGSAIPISVAIFSFLFFGSQITVKIMCSIIIVFLSVMLFFLSEQNKDDSIYKKTS